MIRCSGSPAEFSAFWCKIVRIWAPREFERAIVWQISLNNRFYAFDGHKSENELSPLNLKLKTFRIISHELFSDFEFNSLNSESLNNILQKKIKRGVLGRLCNILCYFKYGKLLLNARHLRYKWHLKYSWFRNPGNILYPEFRKNVSQASFSYTQSNRIIINSTVILKSFYNHIIIKF